MKRVANTHHDPHHRATATPLRYGRNRHHIAASTTLDDSPSVAQQTTPFSTANQFFFFLPWFFRLAHSAWAENNATSKDTPQTQQQHARQPPPHTNHGAHTHCSAHNACEQRTNRLGAPDKQIQTKRKPDEQPGTTGIQF